MGPHTSLLLKGSSFSSTYTYFRNKPHFNTSRTVHRERAEMNGLKIYTIIVAILFDVPIEASEE